VATSLVTVSKDLVEARIAELTAELAKEQQTLATLRPDEPSGTSTVIRFQKFDYTWAAIKVGGSIGDYIRTGQPEARWFVTQDGSRTARQGVPPMKWDDLLDWISQRNWNSIEVLS
jgi:hypothetical protein